ncbi:MAG: AAA family ATPase [Bacteroidota bacterium]
MLKHQVQSNRRLQRKGKPGVPLCIWGEHGIGKTQIVKDFAKKQGWSFVSIALAQFEEMGDLLGMPQVENNQTIFRKPSWVPDQFGPGILLLDDFNRADERIIRGIMPLLQEGRLMSWALPPDWHIILTANPDVGDYSVTPLDEAVSSRMLHFELKFALKAWLTWAKDAKYPNWLIDFIAWFPDLVETNTTSPREIAQFFDSILAIEEPKSNRSLSFLLANAHLDPPLAAAFMDYIQSQAFHLPSAKIILSANDFDKEIAPIFEHLLGKQPQRLDLVYLLWDRLLSQLKRGEAALDQLELKNLEALLRLPIVPKDVRHFWVNSLIELQRKEFNQLLASGDLAALLL